MRAEQLDRRSARGSLTQEFTDGLKAAAGIPADKYLPGAFLAVWPTEAEADEKPFRIYTEDEVPPLLDMRLEKSDEPPFWNIQLDSINGHAGAPFIILLLGSLRTEDLPPWSDGPIPPDPSGRWLSEWREVPLDGDGLPDLRIFELPPSRWRELPGYSEGEKIRRGGRPRSQDPMPGVLMTGFSQTIPNITSPEVALWEEGVSNGKRWTSAREGASRVYRNPKKHRGMELRAELNAVPAFWTIKEVDAELTKRLEGWDLETAVVGLLVFAGLAEAVRNNANGIISGEVAPIANIRTDEIIKIVRKNVRPEDRVEWRRKIRRILLEISDIGVHGTRKGYWPDPDTKEQIKYQGVYFFHVIDKETTWAGGQTPLSGEMGNPLALRIHGGALFPLVAKSPKYLQYLGNLRYLIGNVHGGQTSGMWALAMGLTFAQFVREQQAKPDPKTRISRRDLLTTLPTSTTVEDAYKESFKRVLNYYREAKKELIDIGWWEPFDEPPLPEAERGKLEAWLAQEVQPIPGPKMREPLKSMTDAEDPLLSLAAAGEQERAKRKRGRPSRKKASDNGVSLLGED